jgi:hypothetical protein
MKVASIGAAAEAALAATDTRESVLMEDVNSGASLKLAADATEAKPEVRAIAVTIVVISDVKKITLRSQSGRTER